MSEEENVGFFYNWYAVNDERGLAPEGFHVPDLEEMNRVFETHENIQACIHFAGFKSVGESIKKPEKYYRNKFF